jgi:CRP/FNR family transcriptional regulator, cyclic AMP receptor protein
MLEESSCTLAVRAGHVFFSVGQPAEAVFFLESGSVRTFRIFGARKITIATLRPPALFGEMACFGHGRYHCSAESVEDSRVRLISRESMQAFLECAPSLANGIIDLIGERFGRFLDKLETHAFRGTLPRLATLLLEKVQEEVVRAFTHKDLAAELGVHRESVTAALGELRRAGIIAIERKTIRVLQPARLERATRE